MTLQTHTQQLLALLTLTFALPLFAEIQIKPDPEKGKIIYNGKGACMACHGPTGKGDGVAAAALNPKPRSFSEALFKYDTDKDGKKGTDKDLRNIITKGTAVYGGSPLMAPRPDIQEPDISHLLAFLRSLEVKKETKK